MAKIIRSPVKRIVCSRIGLAALVLHLILFAYCLGQKRPLGDEAITAANEGRGFYTVLFAGRPFHFQYESTLFKTLLLLDFPALVISEGVLKFVSVFASPSVYTQSWIDAWAMLFAGSIQWLLVGSLIEWTISISSARAGRVKS